MRSPHLLSSPALALSPTTATILDDTYVDDWEWLLVDLWPTVAAGVLLDLMWREDPQLTGGSDPWSSAALHFPAASVRARYAIRNEGRYLRVNATATAATTATIHLAGATHPSHGDYRAGPELVRWSATIPNATSVDVTIPPWVGEATVWTWITGSAGSNTYTELRRQNYDGSGGVLCRRLWVGDTTVNHQPAERVGLGGSCNFVRLQNMSGAPQTGYVLVTACPPA